jgi:hypothetical protein
MSGDAQLSKPWVVKPHRLDSLVCGERAGDSASVIPNLPAFNLFNQVIPHYFSLVHTVQAAEEFARQDRERSVAAMQWPSVDTPLTSEWLAGEVRRRVLSRDSEMRAQILQEVAFHARTEANELINQHADELIGALAEQLDHLLEVLAADIERLGSDVDGPAQAIEAGTTEAWSAIQGGLAEYRDIRHLQMALYNGFWGSDWPFDRRACGDSNDVADPEARLYFHRRIREIAPQWRADRRADSFGNAINESTVPWPTDPTERLIWCVRNDSGIWCPTPEQVIAALSGDTPARNTGGVTRVNHIRHERSERATLGPVNSALGQVQYTT